MISALIVPCRGESSSITSAPVSIAVVDSTVRPMVHWMLPRRFETVQMYTPLSLGVVELTISRASPLAVTNQLYLFISRIWVAFGSILHQVTTDPSLLFNWAVSMATLPAITVTSWQRESISGGLGDGIRSPPHINSMWLDARLSLLFRFAEWLDVGERLLESRWAGGLLTDKLLCFPRLLTSTERREGDSFDTPKDQRDFLSEFVGVKTGDVEYSAISGVFRFKLFGILF